MRNGLLLLLLALPAFAEYAEVNGVKMYYEVHGRGRPVLLLHGGLNSIQTSFAKQLAVFARNHRVVAIDQMAHGRTADVPGRALSYEQMAEDTAALMVHLGIRDADVVGWSDGGQLGLRLAFTHPELIRRVVASGVSFGPTPVQQRNLADDNWWNKFANGAYPEGRAEYNRVSPDGPEHWKIFLEKVRTMYAARDWGITEADIAKIKTPVMIVAGDKEKVEDVLRLVRAIPKAKLFVLPGTSHSTFQDRPGWLNPVVLDFLDLD